MPSPTEAEVQALVDALSTLDARAESVRRHPRDGSLLDLLRVIAGHDRIRLSSIADRLHAHGSVVGRRVRECEEAGYVTVSRDLGDLRSRLVTLEPAGARELRRLTEASLDRFTPVVDDWELDDVRRLTELLERLRASMDAVSGRERRSRGARAVRNAGEPDWLAEFLGH